MADIEYHWTKTDPIRIDHIASNLGFNLRNLDLSGISENQRVWIDNKIRNKILSYLDECWEYDEDRFTKLSEVNQGIYVITLADNLSIDYDGKPSPVIYIGRGQIRTRLYHHFTNWIKYFSDSLQGISFYLWMTEIKVKGSKKAFCEVESDLLDYFYNKYQTWPMQNNQAGNCHEKYHEYCDEWNLPLRNPTNIQEGWCIRPLTNNWWSKEVAEYV